MPAFGLKFKRIIMHQSFYYTLLASMAILSLTACQTPTATIPTGATNNTHHTTPDPTLKLIEGVQEHTLDNGLTVIIKEDHTAPVVMTQIWYKVGSNDEPVGKGGLSHFLEHLMFKDTPKVSGNDFGRLISHYGGSNNAYTSSDVTVYHEVLPANRYKMALELEANRMRNIAFKGEQIASERQVVQEERRVRTDDNPMAKAGEKYSAFIYGNTPRARPVIGSMADISALNIADLRHWYDTWYTPKNATIVIVGDVDATDALANVKKYFSHIQSHNKPLPTRNISDYIHADDIHTGKGHTGARTLTIKEAVQVPILILSWQAPTLHSLRATGYDSIANIEDLYALSGVSNILSSGASSRFSKNLERKGLVTSASASYSMTGYGDTLFSIYAVPKAGVGLDETRQLILDEMMATFDGDIHSDELLRGVVGVKTALVFAAEGVSGQASFLGQLKHEGIPYSYLKTDLARLEAVTADDTRRAYHKFLTPERMFSVYIIPDDTTTTQ